MPALDCLQFDHIITQTIRANWLNDAAVGLDVLRTDLLHPVISGNKWFKLQFYVAEAIQYNARTIATFGGTYSNHIVATAYACRQSGIASAGFIRGEKPATLSHTLRQAMAYGMELHFLSREQYRQKAVWQQQFPGYYWIAEGGYGEAGARGAAGMLSFVPSLPQYSHIVAAAGTGTMLAGLVRAALPGQQVIGISALKNHTGLEQDIRALLPEGISTPFRVFHDFHFGGYAKHPPALIRYITECWHNYQLPLDIVYTAKAFFAAEQLIREKVITAGSQVLFVHSGGLQGNLSLPPGLLPF
jgi:1-aminocyclopropane-1-carboxylate deaminase/D-cysteine desulfhydrase-like pyridoxal-dependent ACC family enzyme